MGSLFVVAIVGSAVDGAAGWSTSVMWAFVVSMLPPFPLAAMWSLGSRLFHRKVHRRLLEWAAPRPGQLARGLLSYPIPTAGGHYALSFPFTRWLFPLLLFFTGLHTYWLFDPGKADDRAEPEFWIWYAICALGTVLCGFIPWWLRDNFEKRAMFAMAVVPIDPVAVRVAASLFGEPSAKDQKRWSTVDYPLAHFRQLR